MLDIQFLGGTSTVTGSKTLIEYGGKKILIDCGLFQGQKNLRLLNWEKLSIEANEIDVVILSHAHIDHSGYLPILKKRGFNKKIYCTEGTKELCEILLPDSAHLQEEEANYSNKVGSSKHHPALPLYTVEDAYSVLKNFFPVNFGKSIEIFPSVYLKFFHAGHIIGASIIELKIDNKVFIFSGDLGRAKDLMLRGPAKVNYADYLILESTYGDRFHSERSPLDTLEEIILNTINRGGNIIIPAFAVGRSQEIIYIIYLLKKNNKIPNELPVYLDSPMANAATSIFINHKEDHIIPKQFLYEMCLNINIIESAEESKKLNQNKVPKIIISASGMATGGRILHHLMNNLTNFRNTIVFTGFQAKETRGEKIIRGEKFIKIFGENIEIKSEIKTINSLSAHADRNEILDWLSHFKNNPQKVFINHGEINSSIALLSIINEKYGWNCVVPNLNEKFSYPF